MLLTISTTHNPATDLGFLLHKNPARFQEFALSFGKAYVFYPEAFEERCSAALLLDVDPVGMVRGKPGAAGSGLLDQYVNDRPYVASSFLSVAIARVYGTALKSKCKAKPELVHTPIPLRAEVTAVPSPAGKEFPARLFEPLGYHVTTVRHPLDLKFPEWGESRYYGLTVEKITTLGELLTHLYVLIPVLDDHKHYYVGDDEVEKLLDRGKGWLAEHPEKEIIARRYLKYQSGLARHALTRLAEEDQPVSEEWATGKDPLEIAVEEPVRLNQERIGTIVATLKACRAERVLDLGCGEGKLIAEMLKEREFREIVGMDVASRSLRIASRRLKLDQLPPAKRDRIRLIHGSLMYRDPRFEGFDAAAVAEVVEHLDPPRLAAFERVLFEFARPGTIVLTTPNREYNVLWENVGSDRLRHRDHRFEWTRQEFQSWANQVAERFDYKVKFLPVGTEHEKLGPPTQMAVFSDQR